MQQHVLIVDDSDINLMVFAAMVGKLGDAVAHTFTQSTVACDWIKQQQQVDLIIIDYMMPELDGIEFLRLVRAHPRFMDVPVVMITASDQKNIRYRALDAGANDFLIKPVDKVEFIARVRNLLQLSEARYQLADRAALLAAEVSKATAEILERERDTVVRLCKAAEYRDPETGGHIIRMANYSRLIGKYMGLSEEEQTLLLEAAPMHDLGKVGIPDHILLKPGKLSFDEFEQMKKHAFFGYELLKGSHNKVLQAGAIIALGHHEKFNGTGYPQGLQGDEIPLFCRIVAVADVFDALTSPRPYKRAWSLEEAVDWLHENAGAHFDPMCIKAFMDAWEEILVVHERYKDSQALVAAS
ncbi:response regulator [Curvibacter sp. CHRR-16]|uniref:HD domain-containing phosphohydrolase n=1 Tax=Curvibacter sp. CHRR-16 TaxID=2835872 RepID=UPI001BDB613F|nr:HD domain-containing phosphohydrolase [Curvibacter sp. CHRR-16]MBT0570672.1 response regulator [Curvibacter sp. CHRR-16]